MSSGIGIGISSVFGGPRGLPSDFSYGKKQFCDDDNSTYTPTPVNTGGTWSISPALSGFDTPPGTGAFSPYGVTGTFVVSHTFDGKTSTQTIVLNDSDVVSTFTYPFSSYPQSGVNPTPTITGSGPGINTGTFSATPAGLSINAATGEIDLSESDLNSYVITYTSGSEFCADTATFTLEVEDPYVGFKFRILVPAGADQTLTLETVNGAFAAPNSVINWGDGTGVQALTTVTASNSFPTGTYDIEINAFDSISPVNNFSVTAGETLVTQVIDWGGTPWFSLLQAFKDCTNLTTFGTGTFKGITGGVDLTSCFFNCTSLTSIDMRNWDLSNGSTMSLFSEGCINAESFNLPALTPRTGSWNNAFKNVGTSVADGCAFNFEGLNFTGSTNTNFSSAMKGTKIAPSSSFKDWNFTGSTNNSLVQFFEEAEITGNNSTLDISGWTTFTGSLQRFFYNFNNTPGGSRSSFTGTKLNVTNLNTTSVSDLFRFVGLSNFYSIIGLSTWQANTTPSIDISQLFFNSINLAIPVADNLSDAFMNSLKPTKILFAFRGIGTSLASSEWGAVPNLGSIDLEDAPAGSFQQLFDSSQFSSGNIDFTNIKLPTITQAFYRFAYNTYFSNSDSYILFPTAGVGGSVLSTDRLYESFSGAKVRKITIGNSVDFSTNISTQAFRATFQNVSGDPSTDTINTEITLPTIMNFSGIPLSSNQAFFSMFNGTRGVDSIGSTKVALSSCQVNNLLRNLKTYMPNPAVDNDIVLNNCKYSGPQALVNDDYNTLTSNGWAFGTLSPEAPYFTLSSYSLVTGSESTATINAAYTGGTFTSSNTSIATVNASTGAVTTGVNTGTCQIRYTLADGVCYNEVNLAVTIPLIANNFSFNFDGINDYLSIEDTTISNELTISIWLNPADITNINLLGKSNDSSSFLYINPSSQLNISSSNFANKTFTNTIPSLNTWQHIVLTRDSSNIFRAYKDGLLTDTASTSAAGNFVFNQIGRFSNVNSFNFNGRMDELAVWNTPLTGPQILDIYNGRLGVTNETVDLSKYANLGGNLVYWNRMGD